MDQKELKRMYGSTPHSFSQRIEQTLCTAQQPQRSHGGRLRVAAVVLAAVMLLSATALALFHSQVAEIFGMHFGEAKKEELLAGRIAVSGESKTLGDVVFTLDEVTYVDDGLYAVGHMRPAAGANVLLMSVDQEHTPEDVVGTDHYSGMPAEGPTYGEKAAETGAQLLMAQCIPTMVGVEDGALRSADVVGISEIPQADGSILFTMEIPTGTAVTEGTSYTIQMDVLVYAYGREDETYQSDIWTVQVMSAKGK